MSTTKQKPVEREQGAAASRARGNATQSRKALQRRIERELIRKAEEARR